MSELKDSGILLRLAHEAMIAAGIDADEVLRRCGLTAEQINDRKLRTPHSAQALFWQALEDVSGDPDIGLHLGEHLPTYRGQVLEYLFLSSPTFGEGLKRSLNYQRILSDAFNGELVVDPEQAYLTHSMGRFPLRHLNEALMIGLIKFFQYITEGKFKPTRIAFVHEPGANLPEYERIFGCEILFDQPAFELHFDRQLLDLPSMHAEPELLLVHEQVASEQLAALEKQDLVFQVERIIGELLESGQVSLETVAARLGITPRSLRSKLADAGTNFNQITADYRCRLAKRLLSRTSESIDEIVYLTGFSEPSTFYRAFKRWTNKTPIEYRKEKQQSLEPHQ